MQAPWKQERMRTEPYVTLLEFGARHVLEVAVVTSASGIGLHDEVLDVQRSGVGMLRSPCCIRKAVRSSQEDQVKSPERQRLRECRSSLDKHNGTGKTRLNHRKSHFLFPCKLSSLYKTINLVLHYPAMRVGEFLLDKGLRGRRRCFHSPLER